MPTKLHEPTKNELKLLKYLHMSESQNVTVLIGTPPCYEIIIGKEGRGFIRILQIPFSEFTSQLDSSLSVLLCYPHLWKGRSERRIQANNLKLLLRDMEIHSKAIEDAKLLALKAADEAALRIRIEYDGLFAIDDRR